MKTELELFAWTAFKKHADEINQSMAHGIVIVGATDGSTNVFRCDDDRDLSLVYNDHLLNLVANLTQCTYKVINRDRKMFVVAFTTRKMDYVFTNGIILESVSTGVK